MMLKILYYMKNLLEAGEKRYFTIAGFDKNIALKVKRRLLELGFTRGQKIKIINKSLLKRTYLIELRSVLLTLRYDILKYILVE